MRASKQCLSAEKEREDSNFDNIFRPKLTPRINDTGSSTAKCILYSEHRRYRRKIRLTESNAKCRYLKKFTCKGTLRLVFICLRPSPPLCFCLGLSSYFVGSESGQIQSGKSLPNMVSLNTPTPSQRDTVCIYITVL